MIQRLHHNVSIIGAIAAMIPKLYMAYSIWFWAETFVQILAMTISVFFWRAVYANSPSLGGLELDQTLNYILLMPFFFSLVNTGLLMEFGHLIREGIISIELLRPIDLQGRYYIEGITSLGINFLLRIPLLIAAVVFFGLKLPSDPLVWGAFLVTLVLGASVIFFFDWMVACLAFYTTEVWGLGVVREGVALFFSGALLPLDIMPAWLQGIAASLPFAQAVYVPASVFSGITSLSDVPRLWLVQLIWILVMILLSRLAFSVAVRKVTVQGG